jgi:hypothetical protein
MGTFPQFKKGQKIGSKACRFKGDPPIPVQFGKGTRAKLVISPEAKEITSRLLSRQWPLGSHTQVLKTVQLSLDAYAPLQKITYSLLQARRAADAAIPSPKKYDMHLMFLEEFYRQVLTSPENFVEVWMNDVYDSVAHWKGWNGNLMRLAFKFEDARFQRQVSGWANAFGFADAELIQFRKECRREASRNS